MVYIASSESCEPKRFFDIGTKLKESIFKNKHQISFTVIRMNQKYANDTMF